MPAIPPLASHSRSFIQSISTSSHVLFSLSLSNLNGFYSPFRHSSLTSLAAILSLPNPAISAATATARMLSLVPQPTVMLMYHRGPLLKGNVAVNLLWYGNFSTIQRSILVDFVRSFKARETPHHPSVKTWWNATGEYKVGPSNLVLGKQFLEQKYSLGKSLTNEQIADLASRAGRRSNSISVVLTSADVMVGEFCVSECGMHGHSLHKKLKYAYAWVGNPATQCPGQCAWPFHQPLYGPQTPPLVAPNGDVGIDGMVINLATVLAGALTNPFGNGYYQGLLEDKTTGASYNAVGVNGRKYLLPAMWHPHLTKCTTLT